MVHATIASVASGRWSPCCSKLPTGRTAMLALRSASSVDVAVGSKSTSPPRRSVRLARVAPELSDHGRPTIASKSPLEPLQQGLGPRGRGNGGQVDRPLPEFAGDVDLAALGFHDRQPSDRQTLIPSEAVR